jgi:hypothetical protein
MKSVGDKVPLIFRFFQLVTRDNITYVSPRENAFWVEAVYLLLKLNTKTIELISEINYITCNNSLVVINMNCQSC